MEVHEFVSKPALEVINHFDIKDENYGLVPYLLKYEDQIYYYVHYKTSDRYLVVRKDGQISPLKEIEPVIIMAASFVSYSNAFYVIGDEWIKAKTIKVYRRIQELLDTLEKGLHSRLTKEQRNLLNEFRKTVQTVIDWQQELECVVEEGKKGMDKITYNIATMQDRERLEQLQRRLGECFYEQNQVQLDTYEKRQQLVKSLRKTIPLPSIYLWFTYLELKKHHQKMLNWSKMDAEEIQDTEIVKRRIEGEWDPDSYKVLKKIKSHAINPR